MRNLIIVTITVTTIVSAFFSLALHAADISKVKGQSALIELKGETATAGDSFFAFNSEGKKKAILIIKKVKGDRAIARIAKGKAESGMTLKLRARAEESTAAESSENASEAPQNKQKSSGKSYIGALLGFAMDSMSVDLVPPLTPSTQSLSGTAFSGKVLFDYRLFPKIWFRGTTGLESFQASGASKCGVGGTTVCDVNIYYLSFDGIGRYLFSEEGSFHPWLGGGFGLLFPVSKKSTALDNSSISNTSVMIVAGGFDWILASGSYIPVSIEYGMLPKSDDVTGSWISIRGGYAWGW